VIGDWKSVDEGGVDVTQSGSVVGASIEERFIARKPRDGAEYLHYASRRMGVALLRSE
jgi:hypothetical protein